MNTGPPSWGPPYCLNSTVVKIEIKINLVWCPHFHKAPNLHNVKITFVSTSFDSDDYGLHRPWISVAAWCKLLSKPLRLCKQTCIVLVILTRISKMTWSGLNAFEKCQLLPRELGIVFFFHRIKYNIGEWQCKFLPTMLPLWFRWELCK